MDRRDRYRLFGTVLFVRGGPERAATAFADNHLRRPDFVFDSNRELSIKIYLLRLRAGAAAARRDRTNVQLPHQKLDQFFHPVSVRRFRPR